MCTPRHVQKNYNDNCLPGYIILPHVLILDRIQKWRVTSIRPNNFVNFYDVLLTVIQLASLASDFSVEGEISESKTNIVTWHHESMRLKTGYRKIHVPTNVDVNVILLHPSLLITHAMSLWGHESVTRKMNAHAPLYVQRVFVCASLLCWCSPIQTAWQPKSRQLPIEPVVHHYQAIPSRKRGQEPIDTLGHNPFQKAPLLKPSWAGAYGKNRASVKSTSILGRNAHAHSLKRC